MVGERNRLITVLTYAWCTMAQVVLENVSKRFPDGTLAVDDISLRVDDREFLVLVGPSGCGKSTTLRLIAGLEAGGSGDIRIGDRVVNEVAPKNRDIAMVFQNYALYPHMTVYRNLSFGLMLRYGGGVFARVLRRVIQPRRAAELAQLRSGIDSQVRQAAGRLGIEHLLDRRPYQLSGGERQRVALGRAIVRDPAAFLFDEPLSNLDAKLRQQMRVELKRLHSELNATMIYVTHDQVEAMTLGDRVAVMNCGKIMQVGRPMEIYHQPANLFVARFIGAVPINLWRATVRRVGDHLKVDGEYSFSLQCRLTDIFNTDTKGLGPNFRDGETRDVVIGVRSEDMRATSDPSQGHFRGKVVAIDRLGDSAMVHLDPLNSEKLGNEGLGNEGLGQHSSGSDAVRGEDKRGTGKLAETGGGPRVFRAESNFAAEEGAEISIAVDTKKLNWFDHQTGDNLLKERT